MTTLRDFGAVADRLGEIAAEKANLAKEERALKGALTAYAAGETTAFDGDWYRSTVIVAERATVNWKKIAEKLGASARMIAGNTVTKTVTSVKTAARSTKAA